MQASDVLAREDVLRVVDSRRPCHRCRPSNVHSLSPEDGP